MKKKFLKTLIASAAVLSMGIATAQAGLINITLGNSGSFLIDGDVPGFITIFTIQTGQAAPFDGEIGDDLTSDPVNVNWVFNYAAISDTIVSASFSFGIWGLDSAASASQLDAFALDGTDLTPELDTLFEVDDAFYQEYKIYTINLGNSFFANLADGLFSVDLDIGGSGFERLSGQPVSESTFNSYHLIFSSLQITTEVAPNPPPTGPEPLPEPGMLGLLAFGLTGLTLMRRRRT